MEKIGKKLKQNAVLIMTLTGIISGVIFGFLGRSLEPTPKTIALIEFPGELLLRILKMLVLPLIISSLITSLSQLDPKSSGKMGSRAVIIYVLSTVFSTSTGIIFALIFKPGQKKLSPSVLSSVLPRESISTTDALMDILRNMFPDNIIQACTQTAVTTYKKGLINNTVITELKYVDGTNVMGLVVFCIIFGVLVSHHRSETKIMSDFFRVMNDLIMKILSIFMWYAPIGISFLVACNILKIDDMAKTGSRLGRYVITVISALSFHVIITMQLTYFIIVRKNPFKYGRGVLKAWLTAFGLASTSATLPVTFQCLEENNKVDKRVTRFMLPLGATINMDGTALCQCVATVFIAQLNDIHFNFIEIISVILVSTATSIGVASIPSASLITMITVLSTVGLPAENISYIIAVDWLLDRCRSSVNALGDCYACGIIAHLLRDELKQLDKTNEKVDSYHQFPISTDPLFDQNNK